MLRDALPDYLPKDILQQGINAEQKWTKLIMEALQKNSYVKQQAPKINAKVHVTRSII